MEIATAILTTQMAPDYAKIVARRGSSVVMLKRIKDAWKVLRGAQAVPVYNHPYRIVQLLNFEGGLLGLDGEGKLWHLRWEYGWEQMSVTLVTENPVRRW
jgi:hypothetical protein